MSPVRIGVLSDTHNYLDPKIAGLFAGVAHILHAGDIGQRRVLLELEQIAPVTAVMGNTDDFGFGYPLTEIAEIGTKKFLLHHIVNPNAPHEDLQKRIQRHKPDAVVFGHTHKPFCRQIGPVLFFNPGYAGKQRFGLPRSVAILTCDGGSIRTEYLPL